MRYVIRKVPERNTAYLERLLPDALVLNDENHNGCLWSFHKAIKVADDDAVYVQDDMILCRQFDEKVRGYTEQHRNDVVVFANHTKTIRQDGYYSPRDGLWLMCTYIPKQIAVAYLRQVVNGEYNIKKRYRTQQLDDWSFQDWLRENGIYPFVVYPCLAGHPSNVSAIDPRRGKNRTTKGFDYDNAEPHLSGEEQ